MSRGTHGRVTPSAKTPAPRTCFELHACWDRAVLVEEGRAPELPLRPHPLLAILLIEARVSLHRVARGVDLSLTRQSLELGVVLGVEGAVEGAIEREEQRPLDVARRHRSVQLSKARERLSVTLPKADLRQRREQRAILLSEDMREFEARNPRARSARRLERVSGALLQRNWDSVVEIGAAWEGAGRMQPRGPGQAGSLLRYGRELAEVADEDELDAAE
eukprot:1319180-Rhodomonas_salina.3